MKTSESDKGTLNLWTLWSCVGLALVLGAANAKATGTVNYWTNAAGDLLWSNPLNWSNNVAAGSTDAARFISGTGTTNGPGLVNNIVDVDTTVQNLLYQPVVPDYHTTLINPGVTLTVLDSSLSGELFGVRLGTTSNTALSQVTVRGTGRMVVGDTNNPAPTAGQANMRVYVPSQTAGPFWATLDMSELDYFAGAPSDIRVGASGSGAGTQGTWIMAKTNLVITGATADEPTTYYSGLMMGFTSSSTDYPSAGDVQLGQENVLQLYRLRVGVSRATNGSLGGPGGGVGEWSKAGWGGTMEFRKGLVNPTVKMRGVNGVDKVSDILIGDNYRASSASTNTATGYLDLSGGTVDIITGSLQIGRNVNNSTATRTGGGKGVLTWTAGTIEVQGISRVGAQINNNAGNATGVINVQSNAVLNFTGADQYVHLGNDFGSAAGTGNGTLNIVYGGVVNVAQILA